MMIFRLMVRSLFLWTFVAGPARAESLPSPASNPAPSVAAMLVAEMMPHLQLTRDKLDDAKATHALTLFINILDYDHSYFLSSDIVEFRQRAVRLDQRLAQGDVSVAFVIFDRFKDRAANRLAYVESMLKAGLDLKVKESYAWERKQAPWPASDTEWNELWRKKVKNEFVAREVSHALAEEKKAAALLATPVPSATLTPTGSSNAPSPDEDSDPVESRLSTPESILKRYRQFITTLKDNDPDWLIQRYLCAFTQAYDPHSEYLSPSGLENFDIGMKLSLCGIGAILTSDDGAARVERLIPGGPAERDGRLKAGDKIIAVAQEGQPPVDILHWPLDKAVRLIRGPKNTKVSLTLISASDPSGGSTRKLVLTREEVRLEEQAAKGAVREMPGISPARKLGIVTLPEFYADFKAQKVGDPNTRRAARDVQRILLDLQTQQVAGVVLDLRDNGGGSLAEAVNIAGEFFPSGPVVQVQQGGDVEVFKDPDENTFCAVPLVVLVNRQSASASEIVAGALQDYGRAVIVGDRKTHGKGTVQSLVDLTNGRQNYGALKVTTAGFFRITGGSTQLKGVTPDIVIPSIQDVMELGEEYLPHAITWSTVSAVAYPCDPTLGLVIPELRKRSEARLAQDVQFAQHRALLKRLGDRLKSTDISLNYDDRLAMARDDQELDSFRHKEDRSGAKKAETNDLILNEGLNILSDLVTLKAATVSPK